MIKNSMNPFSYIKKRGQYQGICLTFQKETTYNIKRMIGSVVWIVLNFTIMESVHGCTQDPKNDNTHENNKAEIFTIGGGYKAPGKTLILDEEFEENSQTLNNWKRTGQNEEDFQIVDAIDDKQSYIGGRQSLKVSFNGSRSSFKYPFQTQAKTIRLMFSYRVPENSRYGDVVKISLCDETGKKGPFVGIRQYGSKTLLDVYVNDSGQTPQETIDITWLFLTSDDSREYISPYPIRFYYPITLYINRDVKGKGSFMIRNGNNNKVYGPYHFINELSSFGGLVLENGNNRQAVCYMDQILIEDDVLAPSDVTNLKNEKQKYGLTKVKADERGFKVVPESNIPAELNIRKEDLPQKPQWIDDAIIYQTPIIGASGEGTIQGLIMRIPELKALGINTVYVNPVHENHLGPYAVKDYFSLNPRFGNKEDFRKLVEEVHANGMKIIIDLVNLHTSQNSPLLREHPEYYELKDGEFWSEWANMCRLDYTVPPLWKYLGEIGVYWVNEFDIDGYRCDVAPRIPEDFWRYFKKVIFGVKQDVILLQEGAAPRLFENGFDAGYNGFFYNWLLSCKSGSITHEDLLDNIIYDLTVIGGYLPPNERQRAQEPIGTDWDKRFLRTNYLENHDRAMAIKLFGPAYTKALSILVCTIPGIPFIGWGQEVGNRNYYGMGGEKNEELLNFYKSLFALRNQNAMLRRGEIQKILIKDNPDVIAYFRAYNNEKALVVINFSQAPYRADIPLQPDMFAGKTELTDQLSGKKFGVDEQKHTVQLSLAPYEGVVFLNK